MTDYRRGPFRALTPTETAQRYPELVRNALVTCRHCGRTVYLNEQDDWAHADDDRVYCSVAQTDAEPHGEDREPLICGACEEVTWRQDGETTEAMEARHAPRCDPL